MDDPAPESHLVIPERSLAVFVDDTGHEDFVAGEPYGLGGCAALGRDLGRIIYEPWRDVRRLVRGSPDAQLHANKFPQIAKAGDIETVAAFFRAQPFWRFGAIFLEKPDLPDEFNSMRIMKGVLERRVNEIVGSTLCNQVQVIFESSDRADKKIEIAFRDFACERHGKRIPSECYFMPKAGANPALEVADFVMHAVGRQARHNRHKRGTFLADFCAVFHAVDSKLTSFMEVTDVASAS